MRCEAVPGNKTHTRRRKRKKESRNTSRVEDNRKRDGGIAIIAIGSREEGPTHQTHGQKTSNHTGQKACGWRVREWWCKHGTPAWGI